MNTDRLLALLARSLGALALLTAIVAGIPVALATIVGWPLPRAIPSLDQLFSSLNGQSIDDAVIVKALAVVCWLAWAQFATCVATELIAWRKGRGARRVPWAGDLQPVVAQLIMATALIVHIIPRPSPTTPIAVSAIPAVHVAHQSHTPLAVVPPATAEAAPPAATGATYVVKPREDLWSLAETHLGDGQRWRELFHLNQGKAQPRGDSLQHPRLIRPGWTLVFPRDAVGLSESPTSPPPISMPGPLAVHATPAPPDRTAAIGAFPSPQRDPAPLPCPDPPVPAVMTAPTTPDPPGDAAANGGKAEHPAAKPLDPPHRAEHQPPPLDAEDHRTRAVPVGLLGATLMAAGVVATLDRLRRVQQRRRRAGRAVRMPEPAAAPTEIALRRAAASSPAGRLDLALRAFAHCATHRRNGNPPAVSAVQVGPGGIEILLLEPVDAKPGPFTLSAGGQVWTLPAGTRDPSLEDAARLVGAPLPALVSVGSLGDSTVLIDLEATGCTALVGDDEMARTAFRALTLELATSTWADALDVVIVASDSHALPALERVRIVGSLAEVLPDIEAAAGAVSDALTAASVATTLGARLDAPADGWIPTIVLCADPTAEPDALSHLLALAATGGRGLAAVVLGAVDGTTRELRYHDGHVEATPPGVTLTASGPRTDQADDLDRILVAAADCNGSDDHDQAISTGSPTEGRSAQIVNAPDAEQDFDVLVRLLGPVEIEGAKQHIDRRKAVELVVYLATHPKGVSDERLKTALWLDEPAPQSSFNTTVTRARSRLGADANGAPHIPHLVATGGVYRVGSRVTTDFALVVQHLTAARAQPPDLAMRTLRTALELIRSLPFAGGRTGYEWAFAEGLVARMETVVAEAAHHLAQLALEARDPDLAQWAARQGLLASPGDEVLYRDRMLACDLAGNPAAVEAVMDELVAAVEAVEPYDTLHAETIALYERLGHRRRRTG
jgi:hypothetical protein